MTKLLLEEMTWREIEVAAKVDPVVLVPMGSVEQHGPQTPVGDYRYTTAIAAEIAEGMNVVVAPTIPWGYSEHFRNFPGTLTVRPHTLKFLLEDLGDSLVRSGFRHLMLVCGHKGNLPILEQFAREFRVSHNLRIATIEPLGWLGPDIYEAVYGTPTPFLGHGSDPMQSICMHLFPGDVRGDLLEKGTVPSWNGLSFKGSSGAQVEGHQMHLYMNWEEITEGSGGNGVIGDPTLASAERGRELISRLVTIGKGMVRAFAKLDVDLPPDSPRLDRKVPT